MPTDHLLIWFSIDYITDQEIALSTMLNQESWLNLVTQLTILKWKHMLFLSVHHNLWHSKIDLTQKLTWFCARLTDNSNWIWIILVPYFESTNSSLLGKCALWNFDGKCLPFTSIAELFYNYWKTLFVGL